MVTNDPSNGYYDSYSDQIDKSDTIYIHKRMAWLVGVHCVYVIYDVCLYYLKIDWPDQCFQDMLDFIVWTCVYGLASLCEWIDLVMRFSCEQ
jgi:hypothetical protein